MSSQKPSAGGPSSLVRSNLAVASGTAVSRVTGLLRIVVFGIIIGQSALADAYDGANNSPNSIYELFIGGVFAATLVPLFTKIFHNRDTDAATEDDLSAADAIFSVGIVVLALVTLLSVVLAPQIFHLFAINVAPGIDATEYRNIGTMLTRIFVVQIFFYGIGALATAALNARRRFFAAAWAPVASNIVVICLLLLVPGVVDGQPTLQAISEQPSLRWLLGLGATGGIATMSAILFMALRNANISFHFRPQFRHPAVKQLARLSGWTFGYVVANQIALIVIRNLAEPGSGGPDAYTKAYIFFQLPHGLLAVSLATTFAPELARAVAERNRVFFAERMSLGIRLIALLTLPFSFLVLVIARPSVGALLQHGNFSALAADNTARALMGFSLGLVGFSVYLFVLRGFYAHEDTRTPFIINCFECVLNIVFAAVLVGRYGVLGLGLAFALAYLISAIFALAVLEAKVPIFEMRAMLISLVPMVLSAVVAAELAWGIGRIIGATAGIGALIRVVVCGVVGLATYGAMLALFKVPEVHYLGARFNALRSKQPVHLGE
jgi:putative peptidoglycan lipid II flippase